MTDTKTETTDSKRFRSPPYPFIPLGKAVERAKALHEKARHHSVPFPVLADAWGYKLKSSGLVQTAAALIHFGLLDDEGTGKSRKFQLSNDALRIIQDADPASQKRREALVRAAFSPKIHAELWEKFGALTGISDFVLTNYLTLDRRDEGLAPFSSTAAEELVGEYKETMAFAGVTESDTISGSVKDKGGESDHEDTSDEPGAADTGAGTQIGNRDRIKPPQGKGLHAMAGERELTTGLLSKEASFRLIVSGKIGVKEIERLISKLEFDKEILADEDVEDGEADL